MAIAAADIQSQVGLCECGCGNPTTIAKRSDPRSGSRKGCPRRFLRGHSGGAQRTLTKIPCAYCGNLIYPEWSSSGRRQFCNRACYSASRAPKLSLAESRRDWHLRTRFGISLADYNEMLRRQGGGCAICHRKSHGKGRKALFVDHDHKTGRVRGILCSSCNRALAFLQDRPELFERGAAYLRGGANADHCG